MATKSKLELAVDAGKWEDGLKKAQNSMRAFEQSIGGLERATASEKEKMSQFIQILGNTKSTASTASQQVKEYRSTIERLQVISTKLNGEQKKLADDAMAKLTKRMQEAKGQADQLNQSMNGMSSSGNTTGSTMDQLAGKFGLTTKQLAGFGAALAVGKAALETMQGAMESNEATHDAYARTVEVCDAVTNQFLLDLANADFSNFISGLQGVIDKAIDAYNTLDEFESYAARFNPAQQAQEAQIQTKMQQARAAKAQGDNERAEQLNNEAKELINQLEETTKAFGEKQTKAGYATIRSKMGEVGITDQQIAWYADPKNWEAAQKKANEYADAIKKIKEYSAESQSYRKQGETEVGYNIRVGYAARKKIELEEKLRKDPSLKRAYTFQNIRDSGEEGAAFQQALSNIYGNTMAESRIESLRARADRMDGVITNATTLKTPKTPTTTKPEPIIPEGSIAEAESKIKELQERWRNATTQDDRNSLSEQLKEANAQLDIMKGKVEEVKMPEMQQGISGMNAKAISARESDIKTRIQLIEPGTEEMAAVKENLKDLGTIKAVLDYTDIVDIDMEQLEGMMTDIDLGLDIPDDQWQTIVDEINEQLASLNLPPIELNIKTGGLDKVTADTKNMQSAWAGASKAIGAASSALGQIEDPGAKIAGIIGSALATLAQTFAMSMKGTVTPWDWIAAGISGAATLASISGVVKQSAEYHADGGMVGMSPFIPKGTDTVPAMLTPGEIVLNAAQQRNMADNLQGNTLVAGGTFKMELIGDQLIGVINNTLTEQGKQKIG